MAKDKFFEARMTGIIYAYNIVKKDGIEALEMEIKKRNMTKLHFGYKTKEMDEVYERMSAIIYNNMLTGMLYTLHDCLQFGKVRIKKFKEKFDKIVLDTVDLDYMGQHYVKLEDFAKELNELYDVGIDVKIVAESQADLDANRPLFKHCHVDTVLKELRNNGFADAAEFLDKKLD